MTDGSSAEVLVGLAVVVFLCSRQLTWRPVDPSRIWRMPNRAARTLVLVARLDRNYATVA